jgi:hypothetical protein
VDHRRTPSRKAYVPASWFIVLTIMLFVGAAGWLGWLVVDDDADATVAAPTPSVTTPSATTPAPTETTKSPKPTPTETDEPEPKPEPAVERNAPVSVLNNTTIQGLAATYSAKVRAAGWNDVIVGNWRGAIAGNTVYYPAALQPQGELLGKDLGIDRVVPSVAPMRTDRLTVILSGPQQ